MIVDPGFFDDWHTTMVRDALNDELAPVYILRLWEYCQVQRKDKFEMPAAGLKAQTRFRGDAEQLEAALVDAGFITREGGSIEVNGWAKRNASLIAAWENGAKGGRPTKKIQGKTHGLPMGCQQMSTGQPVGNPGPARTDPMRQENENTEEQQQHPQHLQEPETVALGDLIEMTCPGIFSREEKEMISQEAHGAASTQQRAAEEVITATVKSGKAVNPLAYALSMARKARAGSVCSPSASASGISAMPPASREDQNPFKDLPEGLRVAFQGEELRLEGGCMWNSPRGMITGPMAARIATAISRGNGEVTLTNSPREPQILQ